MDAFDLYKIPFRGLKNEVHQFSYDVDEHFFKAFEYLEFKNPHFKVNLKLNKKETFLKLNFDFEGTTTLVCDISNEEYKTTLTSKFDLLINFGKDYKEVSDELLIIPYEESSINASQYIYEMIILSLPIKKVHPGIEQGTLKSKTLEILEHLKPTNKFKNTTDPRWEKLKKLL